MRLTVRMLPAEIQMKVLEAAVNVCIFFMFDDLNANLQHEKEGNLGFYQDVYLKSEPKKIQRKIAGETGKR